MASISVIVPVYNGESYLERCIDSILNQTYGDFQLILVDDGSPDKCPELCDLYKSKDSRIKVIHRKNGGLSAARNSGIDLVLSEYMTEWITFIDSDDWVHSRYLEFLLDAAKTMQTDIAVASFDIVNEYQDCNDDYIPGNFKALSTEDFFVNNELHPISACGRLFKTSLFENVRFPEGRIHEDRFTTYKLLFKYDKVVYIYDDLYYCYENDASITRSSWDPKRLDDIVAIEQQLKYFSSSKYTRVYWFLLNEYATLLLYSIKKASRSNKKYPLKLFGLKFKFINLRMFHRKELKLTQKEKTEAFKYIFPIMYRIYNRLFK